MTPLAPTWVESDAVGPAATAKAESSDFGISSHVPDFSDVTSTCSFNPFLQIFEFVLTKYRIPSSCSEMLSKPFVYILIGLLISHESYSSLVLSSAIVPCAMEYANPAHPAPPKGYNLYKFILNYTNQFLNIFFCLNLIFLPNFYYCFE